MQIRFAWLLALLLSIENSTMAQTPTSVDGPARLGLGRNVGMCYSGLALSNADSEKVPDTVSVKLHQRSALEAVLLSAAIPGGGQIYNRSYWKVPIIVGIQAFFISQWISNNRSYQYYRSQYAASLKTLPPDGNSILMQERDAYRDQRDSFAWYIAGVYMLSMLDAYIDAELSGFDVSPGLGVVPGTSSVAVCLRIKF